MRDEPDLGSASDELERETSENGEEPRRRRWFGRRRTAAPSVPAEDLDPSSKPEPDWNAVVGKTEGGSGQIDWSAWSPVGAAGVEEEPARPPAPDDSSGVELAPSDPPAVAADEAAWSEWAPDDLSPPGPSSEMDAAVQPGAGEQAMPAAGTGDVPDLAPPADARDASPAGEPTETEGSPIAPEPSPAGDGQAVTPELAPPSPDGAPAPDTLLEEERRYRTTLSWPPPRKRRVGAGFLSLLVMLIMVALLVTNGQIGRDSSGSDIESLPALQTNPEAVPKEWSVYRHPSSGLSIAHPPTWTVRDEGRVVEIRDPSSRARLRIEQRRPPGSTEPEDEWLEDERAFSAQAVGYRRLQLSEASYQGHLAALWEYTYAEGNVGMHVADLQFVTKKDRFTLNFRGPSSDWQPLLPTFQGFLSSFKPPK